MNALVGRLQVWLLLRRHRWTFVLSIGSLVLGLIGLSIESWQAGIIAAIGFTVSVITELADWKSFRNYLHSLQITNAPTELWSSAQPSPQSEGWERWPCCSTTLHTNPALNHWLQAMAVELPDLTIGRDDPLPTIKKGRFNAFRSADLEPRVAYYILRESVWRGRDVRNDAKVRLAGDLVSNRPADCAATIQKTRYFDGVVTNDFARRQVKSHKQKAAVYRGIDPSVIPDTTSEHNVLLPLSKSCASNHIGVSVLIMTSDDSLLIQVQGDRAHQSPGLLVPSGSGSMDWADVTPGAGIVSLACRASFRELREEAGIKPEDVEWVRPVGMYRDLRRGGKPEFIFLARTHDDEAGIRERLRIRNDERRYVHSFEFWDLGHGDRLDTLARHHQANRDSLSPSLDASLHLLQEAPIREW